MEEENRTNKVLNDIEVRVENLRQQAQALQQEKQDLLEVLQDLQDNTPSADYSEADLEDIEFNTERLIIRCLTVEVSVSTPRNDAQEHAYETVSKLVDEVSTKAEYDPTGQQAVIVSYLNACLPEPLSSNVNMRFQEKVLSCTADDQKRFRKRLEKLYAYVHKKIKNMSTSSTEKSEKNSNDNKKERTNSPNEGDGVKYEPS